MILPRDDRRASYQKSVDQITRMALLQLGLKIDRALREHGIVVNVKPIEPSSTRDEIDEVVRAYEKGIQQLELKQGLGVGREARKLSAKIDKLKIATKNMREKAEKLQKMRETFISSESP